MSRVIHRLAVLFACAHVAALPAGAHPSSSFSLGQHSTLELTAASVALTYVLDFREMLTMGLRAELGIGPASPIPPQQAETYRRARGPAWLENLVLEVDGRRLPFIAGEGRATVAPGIADFSTLRMEMRASAEWPALAAGPHRLAFRDENFAEAAAFREVVVRAGAGVMCTSCSVPATDLSAGLTRYPAESATPPPDVREATAEFALASERATPPTGGGLTLPDAAALALLGTLTLAFSGVTPSRSRGARASGSAPDPAAAADRDRARRAPPGSVPAHPPVALASR